MIIWINGAFGSGKTVTAYELHRRIPNSFVYDPENIGFFLNKNLPKKLLKGDFQDYRIWREMNYTTLAYIAKEYDGIVIAPMTIVDPKYYEEIIGKLKSDGILVKHYVLWASKETIQKRLRSRMDGKHSWGAQQINRCIKGLSHDIFQEKIDTEHMTVEMVAEIISGKAGVSLLPDERSKFKRRWDRLKIQIKHIRLF